MKNSLRNLALLVCVATALTACSSVPVNKGSLYQGNSTTFGGDNIVRNDVTTQIRQFERLGYDCASIDSIHAKIDGMQQMAGDLMAVNETWVVQACGKSHSYPVTLREAAGGGVDFSVGFKKQ